MNFWLSWLKSILTLTILLSLLEILLPQGSVGKFAKLVLGLVLIVSIIEPLAGLLFTNLAPISLPVAGVQRDLANLEKEGELLQTLALQPFLKEEMKDLEKRMEGLIILIDQVEEVQVVLRDDSCFIKVKPLNFELERKIARLVQSNLNLNKDQINFENWQGE